MGLGLKLHAPEEALGGRPWSTLRDAIAAFAAAPGDPLLARLVHWEADDGALYVDLHPAEESVEFYMDSAGALTVYGSSAVAGPGFHAYLVEWLEALGRSLGFAWIGDGPDEGDATGYFDHRDFDALQAEHAVWLAGLARMLEAHLADRRGDPARQNPWVLGLLASSPWPARAPHGLASCLGYWDESYFAALAGADEDDCQILAARFFPWWEEGLGARFWDGVGRTLAWSRVAWRPAASQRDRDLYHLVLDCFDRASEIDPGVVPPAAEIAELQRLLSDVAEDRPPAPVGIGFRRHEVNLPLPGGWRLRLPGYFHEEHEARDASAAFWFGDRSVRLSARRFEGEASERKSPEAVLANLDPPEDAEWRREDGLVGFASVVHDPDEEGDACCVLYGRLAAGDALLLLTIRFADEADRAWAMGVWRSVTRQG